MSQPAATALPEVLPAEGKASSPHRTCPLCGSGSAGDRNSLHTQRFILPEGNPLPKSYDVVACGHCGMVYADVVASQQDYDTFYHDQCKYSSDLSVTEQPWDTDRLNGTAGFLASLGLQDSRVLDVGCSNGGLMSALFVKGFEHVYGMDPSPACVENCIKRLPGPVRVREGSFYDSSCTYNGYDIVTCSHVLEHVKDVNQAVKCIHTLLTNDGHGRAYIEVPDASRYGECLSTPFQDFNTEHINHFSAVTLCNLMASNGFEPEQLGTKTLLAPPPHQYPTVYGVFHKCRDYPTYVCAKDDALRSSIEAFIESSRTLMNKIEANLQRAIVATQPIIVWGTGELTFKLLEQTSLGLSRIAFFVDSNPIYQRRRLMGRSIIGPDEITTCGECDPNKVGLPIVIASTLHQEAIIKSIKARGLDNPIVTLDRGMLNEWSDTTPLYARYRVSERREGVVK